MSEVSRLHVKADSDLAAAIRDLQRLNAEHAAVARQAAQMASATQSAQAAVNNAYKGMGAGAVAAGALMASAVTAGANAVVGGVQAAVTAGAEYGTTLNRISAVSGATASEMDQVNQQALKLGADLPLSAKQAADGMLALVAGGMNVSQALEASTGTAQLAAAHMLDVGVAAEITSGTLNSFKMSADQAGYAADVMSQFANASAGDITDWGNSIRYIGPLAGALKQPIEDIGVALGLMANNMIKGDQAGTSMRSILTTLAAPGKEAASVMQQLGIVTNDASGKMLPFIPIAEQFRSKMAGLTDAQKAQVAESIAGREGMSGFLAIINASQESFDGMVSQMNNATGATQRFSEATNRGFGFEWDQLKGSIDTVLIQGFQAVEPILINVTRTATGFVNSLGEGLRQAKPAIDQVVSSLQGLMSGSVSVGAGAGSILNALGMDAASAAQIASIIDSIVDTVRAGMGVLQATLAAFRTGGLQGGASALLQIVGVDPGTVSQVQTGIAQVQSAVQTGLGVLVSIVGSVLGVVSSHWQAFAGGLAAVAVVFGVVVPLVSTLAAVLGVLSSPIVLIAAGVAILGALFVANFTAIQGAVNTVLSALSPLAPIAQFVLQGLTGLAQFVGAVLLASLYGLGQAAIWLAGILGPVITTGVQMAGQAFQQFGPILFGPVGALLQFGANWQSVLSTVIAQALGFVDTVRAGWSTLTADIGVVGAALRQAATGDFAGAWETLKSGVQQNQVVFQNSLQNIAANTAERTAEIRATFDRQLSGIPDIVGKYMSGAAGQQSSWLSRMRANAEQEAAAIRAAIANATLVGNLDREDRRATNTLPILSAQAAQQSAQSVQQTTQATTRLASGLSGLGSAASGASQAARTAEDKIKDSADAIKAVAAVVTDLAEFLKDGLGNLAVGEGADQIVALAADLVVVGRRMADALAAAATGLKDDAFKGAQTLSQGISAASSALSSVVGLLPKLWEFVQSPAWGEMQGSLGMMLGVAQQLIQWGRSLFDVMAAASAGVTEESAKAAQALAQGISASAQAVSAVIGLLPKLWEFVTSVEFDEIMASLPMLAEVAGKLIEWGRILFDLFSAAAAGVSQESAAAAQALAQGIGSAAQAITAVIQLIPQLLDFSAWQQGMAVLEGPGRAAILELVAGLSELARLIFDAFASAAMGIQAKAVAAAQRLADGVKAAGDGLTTVITLIPQLLNFAGWSVGFAALNDGQVRATIVYIAQRLAQIGRLVMDAWGSASGQLSSYTLTGAKALTDGVKTASDGLQSVMSLLPALLSFSQLATGFALLNDDAIRALIVYTAQRLVSLGRVIVDQFSAAGADLSSYTVQGASTLAEGVKSSGEALTTLISLLPALLNFSQLAQGFAILNSEATQGVIIHIAVQLGELAALVYRAFYLGAQQVQQNIPVAALALTDALQSASAAMLNLMTLGPSLLNFASQAQGWRILNDEGTRAGLVDIGFKLGALAQSIYRAFYLGAMSVQQNIPVAALALTDALKSASDAMQTVMSTGPALLAFVATEGGWRIVTDGAVQANIVYIAGRLGELSATIYRAFYLASAALLTDIPPAATELASALGASAEALSTVMELGPALQAFALTDAGWRIVTSDQTQANVAYIAERLAALARTIYDRFAVAAGSLTSDAVAGSKALADGIVAAAAGLVALTEVSQKLLGFNATAQGWQVITSDSLRASIVYIAQRLALLARSIYDVFSAAAGSLTSDAVAGARALSDGIAATASAFDSTTQIIELLTEPPDIPNIGAGTPLYQFLVRLSTFARDVTLIAMEAVGAFTIAEGSGLKPLAGAVGDALSTWQGAVDVIKLATEPPDIPALGAGAGSLRDFLDRLARFAEDVTRVALDAVGAFTVAEDSGLSALASAIGDALSVWQNAVSVIELLTEPPSIPALGEGAGSLRQFLVDLATFGRDVTRLALDTVGVFTVAEDSGLAAVASSISDALGVWQSALDTIKLLTEPPDIPQLGEGGGSLRQFLIDLALFGRDVTRLALDTIGAFTVAEDSGLGALASSIGDALSTWQGATDVIKLLTEPPDIPQLGQGAGSLRQFLIDLAVFAEDVSRLALDTVGAFAVAEDSGLAALAGVIGDALSTWQGAVDAIKLLAEPPTIPTLGTGAGSLRQFLSDLAVFAEEAGQTALDAIGAFTVAEDSGLGALASSIGDAVSTWQSAVDVIKLLAEPPSIPALGSGAGSLRQFLFDLAVFAEAVGRVALDAVGAFVVAEDSGLSALASAIGDALSTWQGGVDTIKLLTEPPAIPRLGSGSGSLRQFLSDLAVFGREVTRTALDAVGAFAVAENNGLAALAASIGDALSTWQGATDTIELLTEPPVIPSLGMGAGSLRQFLANLAVFAREVTRVALDAVGAFSVAEDNGLSALAQSVGDALSAWQGAADVIDLLTDPPSIPSLGAGAGSLRQYLADLAEWAQDATELARDAAADFSIAEDSGLSQLAGAVGDVVSVIDDGLNLRELMDAVRHFTGIDFGQLGPKIDLLIANAIEVARRFAEQAARSGISEAWADAASVLASVFGDASGVLNDMIDLAEKLLDPEVQIPSTGQIQAKLTALINLARDVATQVALAASGIPQEDQTAAGKFGETMDKMFGGLIKGAEAIREFTGIYTGSSGLNNIRESLRLLFSTFKEFAPDAEEVNKVAAALSSILGGLANITNAAGAKAATSWIDAFITSLGDANNVQRLQAAFAAAMAFTPAAPGGGAGEGQRGSGEGSRSVGQRGSGEGQGVTNYHFHLHQSGTGEATLRSSRQSFLGMKATFGARS